jgi:uncharacterized protein (DUF2336 family)
MAAIASLIPELEEVVQNGSPQRRAETLKRITNLFVEGATRFNDAHVDLFGDVFGRLIEEIETKARSELSRRIAPIGNAPRGLVRRLANDDDIAVAGPVLMRSDRLGEPDLIEIAQRKSQAHLFAISGRSGIGEAVTDVLVRRGDREVVRSVANNRNARISDGAFTSLVKRADDDGVLAEKVGLRADIPPHLFRDLLVRATDVVQKRLLAAARPETQAEVRRVLAKISKEAAGSASRNYAAAQEVIRELHDAGQLDEASLIKFADGARFEETVAALSALCAVPIDVVDRLMTGDRPDPVLILCKAVGFGWQTVRAVINTRAGAKPVSNQALDAAYANFEKLSPSTAQRVVRFWQVRDDEGAA